MLYIPFHLFPPLTSDGQSESADTDSSGSYLLSSFSFALEKFLLWEKLQEKTVENEVLKGKLKERDARIEELEEELENYKEQKTVERANTPPSRRTLKEMAEKKEKANASKQKKQNSLGAYERSKNPDRSPGKQPGSKGSGFSLPETPDVMEKKQLYPPQCSSCPRFVECKSGMKQKERRNVVDIRCQTVLTQYTSYGRECPESGAAVEGQFPKGVTSSKQYGRGVEEMIYISYYLGGASMERTAQIVGALGIPISTGAVCARLQKVASSQSLQKFHEQLRPMLLESPTLNADETGVNIKGSLSWVHVIGSPGAGWQYTVSSKRGVQGMIEAGILPFYTGVVIHDCWAPYWNMDLGTFEHGLCNAHFIRELQACAKHHEDDVWIPQMVDLLYSMGRDCQQMLSMGRAALPSYKIRNYERRYERLLSEGEALHKKKTKKPKSQRGKKGKIRQEPVVNLLIRMRKHKDAILRCMRDLGTPFTNNAAEQAARIVRMREKVSGCFATQAGAKQFFLMLSFLRTAYVRGYRILDAIRFFLADRCELVLSEQAA